MQGSYNGHISSFGETIDLIARDGSTVSTVTTPSVPTNNQLFLRVSEIMYHPADPTPEELAAGYNDGEFFEFIELHNTSNSISLELENVEFTAGIGYRFGDVTLPPGGYIVLASNPAAFAHRYGAIPVAGQYTSNLSNGGENLKLEEFDGGTIHDFEYDDVGEGWHPTTDGAGHSLVIVDPLAAVDTWNIGSAWRPSTEQGGSPGEAESARVEGDIDGDLKVDLVDLAILQSHFGIASGATPGQGDLNADGTVNRADAAILARNFGRTSAAAGGAPASIVAAARTVNREKPIEAKSRLDRASRTRRIAELAVDLRDRR